MKNVVDPVIQDVLTRDQKVMREKRYRLDRNLNRVFALIPKVERISGKFNIANHSISMDPMDLAFHNENLINIDKDNKNNIVFSEVQIETSVDQLETLTFMRTLHYFIETGIALNEIKTENDKFNFF